jgi:hypothetical protein
MGGLLHGVADVKVVQSFTTGFVSSMTTSSSGRMCCGLSPSPAGYEEINGDVVDQREELSHAEAPRGKHAFVGAGRGAQNVDDRPIALCLSDDDECRRLWESFASARHRQARGVDRRAGTSPALNRSRGG